MADTRLGWRFTSLACVLAAGIRLAVASPASGTPAVEARPFVIVLGIAQDGGCPQAGCTKPCCERVWRDPSLRRNVACLAIVDPVRGSWLVNATPDFTPQLHALDRGADGARRPANGILLTHAHGRTPA
jgi:pyrroloquinoline quinone biosynthesis protein B